MKKRDLFCTTACASALLAGCLALAACNDDTDGLATTIGQTTAQQDNLLDLNGNSDIYAIDNGESAAWSIEETPRWVTPVKKNGLATDSIRLYVESNSRTRREGTVVIRYADGRKRSVAVRQSTEQTFFLQRTYAVGWSFDVRTYMDFRGLRDQVFNTQKLLEFDPDCYKVQTNASSQIDYYQGESGSELSDNMGAKLQLDGNFSAFSLDVQASFGKTALNDSKRLFTKIRSWYQQKLVTLEIDELDAQEAELFTADFAAEREKVIKSGGSDETIRELIDHYGTHFIKLASLGGFYEYYFSSRTENVADNLNIQAAVNVGFADKFGLNADANYRDDFNSLDEERIEKFTVKGGDAAKLATEVAANVVNADSIESWRKSLTDEEKYELMSFQLSKISSLFPDEIRDKIDNYTDRLYYYDLPVTRSLTTK